MSMPFDFASVLRGGQQLVPDFAAEEARKRLLGLQEQQIGLQVQKARTEAEAAKLFQDDLDQVLLNPTSEAYARLHVRHPEYTQQIKNAWSMLDDRRRETDLRQMGEVYSAAANGKWDIAAKALRRRVDADKAEDGIADAQDEAVLAALESGDPLQQKAALGQLGIVISAITGQEKFAATLGALGENPMLTPKGERKGQVVGRAIGHYDENGQWVVDYRDPDSFTLSEGQTRFEGGGDPSSGGGGALSGAPRSVLNNNPGNLRASEWTKSQPGYQGTDGGGYAIFASPEQGQAAQAELLRGGGYFGGGRTNVVSIIEKWAPRASAGGDNTDAQVNGYISYVARKLGVKPTDTLSEARLPAMAQAMAEFEAGTTGQAGAASGPRAVAQGAPKPGYRMLAPQEVSQYPNLDPGKAYQISPEGQITAVGGTDRGSLRPWPAMALISRATHDAALINIEGALKLLDPKNKSKEARTARDAIGPGTGMLGDIFTQLNNPEGTDARARIGQIGGLIIKDTSGAAVTMSEDQRLAKWVPLTTDRPQVAYAKLQNLKRELSQRNYALDETYTEDQGFRPRAVSVRSLQEYNKLPSGTQYTDPTGKLRVKR